MTDTPAPSRISAKDIITLGCAIIGAAFVISGAIRGDGQRDERLQVTQIELMKNAERDEANQRLADQRNERQMDMLSKLDSRTARTETKIDMMLKAPGQ